jgi:lysophospholipase L1-like esterase
MSEQTNPFWSPGTPLLGAAATGADRSYVRFVALGDSASFGVGDLTPDGELRGWARILADAIASAHDLSFCNVATSGATTADVWNTQLPEALRHRAHLASLIVGLNDTMRASWDPVAIRTSLLMSAAALTSKGALLMTVRFHDHARVMRLPRPLARMMTGRLEELNEILDEVHRRYGGIQLDLSAIPEVYEPRSWSADRLHPSERGHRLLASHFAARLQQQGLSFPLPSTACTGQSVGPRDDARWALTQVVPWLVRRARDLGPALAVSAYRATWSGLRPRRARRLVREPGA